MLPQERRTALHYAGTSSDAEETWRHLTEAGADPSVVDTGGFSPAYYMHHPRRARPPQPRGVQHRPDKGVVWLLTTILVLAMCRLKSYYHILSALSSRR